MKHCILHIGQSKTGTSAIQSFLYLNKEKLHGKGILYPGVKLRGVTLDLINHNSVADSLSGLKRYPEIEAEEYFRQFSEQLKNDDYQTMIISGEHYFGGEPRVWDVQSKEEYIDAYRKKLQALRLFMQDYALTIIIYLRSQVEWIESAISQVIRYEGLIGKKIYRDDDQFFELMKPVLDYDTLLGQWDSILKPSNIICIPYRMNNLHDNSSVSDFLWRLGIDDENLLGKAIEHNKHDSLSREYIELKKILNKEICSKTEERVRIYCLNKANNKNGNGEKYHISRELYRRIQEYSLTINIKIAEKYINDGEFKIKTIDERAEGERSTGVSDIVKATKSFYEEYYSFLTIIKRLEFILKAFLRAHARPVHAFLYKVKTVIKIIQYR
jgi:hypothetical protein